MAETTYKNAILARLNATAADSIGRHLHATDLPTKTTIYQPGQPIRHLYFVELGMVSVVSVMANGSSIEVGTIGNEGVVGATLLMGARPLPYQYFVQLAGHGFKVNAEVVLDEAQRNQQFRELILQSQMAFLTQSMQCTACNGLHDVSQRSCRWLLMSHDRAGSNVLFLTHEFLALMLGVRRASVSEVLRPLQDRGWIETNRGEITILDRAGLESGSCECYRLIREQQTRAFG